MTSPYCAPEWAAAFREDPTGEKGKLVPVRVRECDLEGLLGSVVYRDQPVMKGPTVRQTVEKVKDVLTGRDG